MGRKKGYKVKYPPLPPEKLKICPGGESKCPVCKLDVEDLKYVNNLRTDKGWSHEQIRQYLKATFGISPNINTLVEHYNVHLTASLVLHKKGKGKGKKSRKTPVSKAIDTIPKVKRSISNVEMETAYKHLTQLAKDFTQKVQKIYSVLDLSNKNLKEKLGDLDPLTGMSVVAKLSKEARELLKDLSALRAPKIVVAHFLEQAVDEIISETGFVLSDISKNMQEDLLEALRTKKTISTDIFTKIFQEAAVEYRDKMIALRRDQLSKATATLADLEKLI